LGQTYCALGVGSLIITVRCSAERSTRAGLATATNASPLCEVLLTLLLADLDLLLLAAAAKLLGLECTLRLDVCATVLGNVAFTHGGYVICSVSLWAFRRVWRCVAGGL
jgi:hypothetical protein